MSLSSANTRKLTFGRRKKGQSRKSSGPKAKKYSRYRGQGK
jgi:hypothetical protein